MSKEDSAMDDWKQSVMQQQKMLGAESRVLNDLLGGLVEEESEETPQERP